MKEPTYFVISNSGGDTSITQMTRDKLLEQLDPNKYGYVDLIAADALESVPDMDTNYWGNGFLIIKGEIVTPKAMKIITKFEI